MATYSRLSENDKDDILTVDTDLAHIDPPNTSTKTTFHVDMGIFNKDGVNEVQVEGLTVTALSHTLPKDDYELYLHTVMDLDPMHEIVQIDHPFRSDYDPGLVEDCARVASFFVRNNRAHSLSVFYEKLAKSFPSVLGDASTDYWPSDTQESIDRLIENSDFHNQLDAIRTLGHYNPDFISNALPAIVDETYHLSQFKQHVGRISKQIVHRFPQMNILGLAGPESELLTDVLSAIGSSFSSFVVGAGTLRSLENPQMLESTRRKIKSMHLDLSGDFSAQLGSDTTYDMVVLSAAVLDIDGFNVLKNIRNIMTPGGFLVFIQSTRSSMKDRLLKTKQEQEEALTPPVWPDVLDQYGFVHVAKGCNQSFYLGSAIMVRQLDCPTLKLYKDPSGIKEPITDRLLVVGYGEMKPALERRLGSYCQMNFYDALGCVDPEILVTSTAAIILTDIDKPLMSTMSQEDLDLLRILLRPNMNVLWVTRGSRHDNPDAAATFGFTRTVSAEIPNLRLQMLDFETLAENSGDVVADSFISLAITSGNAEHALWTEEREVHIVDGQHYIPRVVPFKSGNDQVNSMRRVVSNPTTTLQETIQVNSHPTAGGLVRYEAGANPFVDLSNHGVDRDGGILIRVNYSSVEAFKLPGGKSGYVCIGYQMSTKKPVIALSGYNASYVSVPESLCIQLSNAEFMPQFMGLAIKHLVAGIIDPSSDSVSQTPLGQFVLIDADPQLSRIIADVTSRDVTCFSTKNTNEPGQNNGLVSKFLHPHASGRQIDALFPPSGGIVVDFQLEHHGRLSERISTQCPAACTYRPRHSIFGVFDHVLVGPSAWKRFELTWTSAVARARSQLKQSAIRTALLNYEAVSLPELLSSNKPVNSTGCQFIDWRANREVRSVTPSCPASRLFHPHRTYVLVGLTKDFGQSLCNLLVKYGARHIVLASRRPPMNPAWTKELGEAYEARIEMRQCDVVDMDSVIALRDDLAKSMPRVGGIANGAMVLDDRVFAQMDVETWHRVLRPKTVGSSNLDKAFKDYDLDFFIMTSSFAAIGGHPGQSNYAAANMYMNGLATSRRRHGLAASVLNIGVIYGLGFLQREKEELYVGLEREGYPPISERDIHHMFIEAIAAGLPKPSGMSGDLIDLTTGLSRFNPADPNPLHWHSDPRFSHYTRPDVEDLSSAVGTRQSLKETVESLNEKGPIADAIAAALGERLQSLLRLDENSFNSSMTMPELGVDSLAAVEVRGWVFKNVDKDISVIKLLSNASIQKRKLNPFY